MIFSGLLQIIRKSLRFILKKPISWLSDKLSSSPDKEAVMKALTDLYAESDKINSKKLKKINLADVDGRVIIFSDQHRGKRNGSDDFAICEKSYLTALDYYNSENFYFINLGDCEELWENTMFGIAKYNGDVYKKENLFIERNVYCKIFGNHDLFWDNDPLSSFWLKKIYGNVIPIFTGAVVRFEIPDESNLNIFCTHGHQGDKQSDGNAFSKWFVSYVWGPLQDFLEINTNNPSTNDNLKTLHNMYMYDWSATQKNTILVTGHTHQPVFNSLTHLERLYQRLEIANSSHDAIAVENIEAEIPRRKREYNHVSQSFDKMKPSYFNSGCCCFDDGTITGIEICDGYIRLVKWSLQNETSVRFVVEENDLRSISKILSLNAG
jgi:predicted phosphodiesterase